MPFHSDQVFDLVVVGGGASGFMGAITAAEEGLSSVLILEAASKPLGKVRISGGGRCNVTHACWDINDLVTNYPRGSRPLLSPFSRFACGDAIAWFVDRGVDLIEEKDGRMFPVTNNSGTVISCLRSAAKKSGVIVQTGTTVNTIEHSGDKVFLINCRNRNQTFCANKILLATGSHPTGRSISTSLGHTLEQSVPSLFSFSIDNIFLKNCIGLSFDNVHLILIVNNKKFEDKGSILITHWGLSGPLVLRLTAFAARVLSENGYKAELIIDWLGMTSDELRNLLSHTRQNYSKYTLQSFKPFQNISKRFWINLLFDLEIDPLTYWADFSLKMEMKLIKALLKAKFDIKGRGPYGEEFVTAGGVNLDEIDMVTMQSRICTGLYFAGELLNIDGLTGGFNFQHCWTSGWLAGKAIAEKNNS